MRIKPMRISKKWQVSLAMTLGLAALVWLVGTTLAQGPEAGPASGLEYSPQGGSPTETFAYQGFLEIGGVPANGVYDFRFSVWDQSAGGSQYGSTMEFDSWITVVDGVFTAYLFPAPLNEVFTGGMRWLQIEVRPGDSTGIYTNLGRQPIVPAPYAWGLRPEAVIRGDTGTSGSFGTAILNVDNTRALHGGGTSSAVYAKATTGSAVKAESGGVAIYGYSPWTYAVQGVSGSGTAGRFISNDGYGVYAEALGNDHWDHGGYFSADMGYGVYGVSTNNDGVRGEGYTGVKGEGQETGVIGKTYSPTGWAGYFHTGAGHGLYVSAPSGKAGLTVASGTKNAVVGTDEGSRLLYSEESTEVWFSDYGFGQLQDGLAVVPIDPVYAQTVNLAEPYHVFVQVYGDAEVYVAGRTPKQFEVRLRDGDPGTEFSYRIVAKRLGYVQDRLEPAPWADNDPNLYPERQPAPGGMQQPGGSP